MMPHILRRERWVGHGRSRPGDPAGGSPRDNTAGSHSSLAASIVALSQSKPAVQVPCGWEDLVRPEGAPGLVISGFGLAARFPVALVQHVAAKCFPALVRLPKLMVGSQRCNSLFASRGRCGNASAPFL